MTTQDLFNRLTEANFAFTKPCFENEKAFLEEQKKSMNKLIVCGLAEKISENKYSLSADGRKASVLGAEKWAKSLNDIDRRVLVYDCFEFFNNWYSLPRLKITLERSIKSNISKQVWDVIKLVIIGIVFYIIKIIFNIKLN
jgi:hypothetical protein